MRRNILMLLFIGMSYGLYAQRDSQKIPLTADRLQAVNVSMSFEKLDGEDVVKVVEDPAKKGQRGPKLIKVTDSDFTDGTIEVKLRSRIKEDAPELARGFIGVLFRINDDYSRYENIYLRPLNGMVDDQVRRNHTVQYSSTPGYAFVRLREESPEMYESYADIALDEWIKVRIEVKGEKAKLFINDSRNPSLVVNDLKLGADAHGFVGISVGVDFGTIGYISDLKIDKK